MPINIRPILLGQGLSIVNTLSGVCASLLLILGLQLPLFQLVIFYGTLSVVYTSALFYKQLRVSWIETWKVLIAAITDTQGNFFVVLAYNYTSLTSVFILMNSSVPIVCVLSCIFLKKRFHKFELGGVFVALGGIVCIVISDLKSQHWQWDGYFYGDLMVLVGTLLYCV